MYRVLAITKYIHSLSTVIVWLGTYSHQTQLSYHHVYAQTQATVIPILFGSYNNYTTIGVHQI